MPVSEVADGIYQVRLPLPFVLNLVNVYLLRGDDGWTVIDTGLNTPQAQAVWRTAFESLGLTPRDLRRIILTHHHPDHFGMAGWLLAQGADAPILMSVREAELARETWMNPYGEPQGFEAFLVQCGVPEGMIDTVAGSMTHTARATQPHPSHLQTLSFDETLRIGGRDFTLIHAPGHSDGQFILYDPADRLLLSGDHVLMKITPNIGLWPSTEPDPLGRFLDSLRSLQPLDVRLALPGHKALITDWRGRLSELLEHHEQRLEHTLAAVGAATTVYEASLKVFESIRFTPHEWRFATAETLAHLEYLRLRGHLRQETDERGVWRFFNAQ